MAAEWPRDYGWRAPSAASSSLSAASSASSAASSASSAASSATSAVAAATSAATSAASRLVPVKTRDVVRTLKAAAAAAATTPAASRSTPRARRTAATMLAPTTGAGAAAGKQTGPAKGRRLVGAAPLRNDTRGPRPATEEEEEDGGLDTMPNDTMAAVQYLRARFPRQALPCPAVVLAHQLYTVVHSRTAVDRDLEAARAARQLLKFRLPNKDLDVGLVLMADYRDCLAQARAALDAQPQAGVDASVVDRLLGLLTTTDTDVSIGRARLEEALGARDAEIVWLVRQGFFTLRDAGSLWFAVPQAGPFLSHLGRGRTELQAVLKRRQYREIMEKQLRLKPLKRCALGWDFLLADAVGSGVVERLRSPDGFLIRLATKTPPS